MPANPALGLHANRVRTVPDSGGGGKNRLVSRSNILSGKVKCAFGSGQSMQIISTGIRDDEPGSAPQKWLPAGVFLRVPKCVILSTVPFWTMWWPNCYFLGPRDVIGQMGTAPFLFGNYYYFDQWNDVTTKPQPEQRFDRIVGFMDPNPWYQIHQQLTDIFNETKNQLESPPPGGGDPIFCIVPEWMPTDLHEIRNDFLKQSQEDRNSAHGGAPNGSPCDIIDAKPCYNFTQVPWGPAYPDYNNNPEAFIAGSAPWLASTHPFFGTDVLHLYVGHPVMKYFDSSLIWDWQAWPATPEALWIAGPIFGSNYLGSPNLPFFAGRRLPWKDAGLDYGYTGIVTPQGLYESRYVGIIEGAASIYKQEFYNYRNFGTRLFRYNVNPSFSWNKEEIYMDQKNDCPTTQFFFGWEDFSDFAAQYDGIDSSIIDCEGNPANPAHLKYGETANNFPGTVDLQNAVRIFYPPIIVNIQNYYNTCDPGSLKFFKIALENNDLTNYNVETGGLWDYMSADTLIEYIRNYYFPNGS